MSALDMRNICPPTVAPNYAPCNLTAEPQEILVIGDFQIWQSACANLGVTPNLHEPNIFSLFTFGYATTYTPP